MQLNTNYGQYAAGPLDPKLMYLIDAGFQKKKWFKVIKRSHGYKYQLDENVEEYKKYFENYFRMDKTQIEHLINLFRKLSTDFCEIVATLFFVWKNNLRNNTLINDTTLFKGFYDWHESKKRFKEQELSKALNWMRENSIIPIS